MRGMSNVAVSKRGTAVSLAGQEYAIQALPMGKARAWRQKFAEPIQQLMGLLENADAIQLDSTADLMAVAQQILPLALNSMDLIVEALFAYAPTLRDDRERIEAEADDAEALAALWEVLKLAYPFGSLGGFLNGAALIGTLKN